MKLTNSTTTVTALSNLTPQSTFIVAILCRSPNYHYLVQVGNSETQEGEWTGKTAGHIGRPGWCNGGHILQGARDQVPPPSSTRQAQPFPPRSPLPQAAIAIGRRTDSRLVSRHHKLLQLRDLAHHPVYPCHYSIAALVCLSGAIQSTLLALCIHRDMEHWRLGLNIRLYSSAYAGIVASGCAFPLMSWCLRKKGPLYVAMFGPLIVVFDAVLSSIFLDETLHLGIVLGAVLIVAGLYMVLWGKAKEEDADRPRQDEELGKASVPVAADANGETKLSASKRRGAPILKFSAWLSLLELQCANATRSNILLAYLRPRSSFSGRAWWRAEGVSGEEAGGVGHCVEQVAGRACSREGDEEGGWGPRARV